MNIMYLTAAHNLKLMAYIKLKDVCVDVSV